MFWADSIVDTIQERFAEKISRKERLVIRDEKTLSGRVHVGSLRGIVLHGILSQILTERSIDNTFLFELNDMDPMDGLPVNIDQAAFTPHMGKPLFSVPPVEEGLENFTTGYGEELKEAVAPMGLPIEWYFLQPLYREGKFNETIERALEHPDQIRQIYLEVSGGQKADDWLPLNVVCPHCGKIGTTKVTGWDNQSREVTFRCIPQYVSWAEGCGHEGSISPFDGNATLPWKVEWAAKWKVLGIDIEAAGKDHYASGGSREIAARIAQEVFDYPEPFGFLYEFFNFAGKKMSASKGLGAAAKDIADMLPPKLLKFFMIRKEQNQPIDFDPEGKSIPNLFDEYDRCADHFFKRHDEPFDGYSRAFQLAQSDVSTPPNDLWEMRFQALSFIVQMPHLSLEDEAEKLKGSALTDAEKIALHERADYVRIWIDTLAPDQYKYIIQKDIPTDLELSDEQQTAFVLLVDNLSSIDAWTGENIHDKIHRTKEESGVSPKDIFQPLYKVFLGRKSGPQVGWFLSTMDQKEVIEKLQAMLIL